MSDHTLFKESRPMTAVAEREHVGEMSTLDETGDTKIMWDRNNPAEVDAARVAFNRLVGESRFAAFKATGERGARGAQIREFDAAAERIILVPPMVGG